jgi:hypothetical protein
VRTLAVIFVLAVIHAPFAAWLFLALVWWIWPQPVRVQWW